MQLPWLHRCTFTTELTRTDDDRPAADSLDWEAGRSYAYYYALRFPLSLALSRACPWLLG
jgi:hypothetical protein